MSTRAVEAFSSELLLLIERFRLEWELTYSEIVGCLEIAKIELATESLEEEEDE
jgi:hypothetical protein